jgi:hypothetical protein
VLEHASEAEPDRAPAPLAPAPGPAPSLALQRRAVRRAVRAVLAREPTWTELKDAYDAALAASDWKQVALRLNGMSEKDILVRLRALPVESIKQILASAEVVMKDWPDRVRRLCRQVILEKPVPAGQPAPRFKAAGSSGGPPPGKEANAKWVKFMATRDAKAREFGAADYQDYVENMLVQGGSVVGLKARAANPLHPLFLDRLEDGSRRAQALLGSTDFGIRSISGQENRPGNHAWGIASDFDADSNPYVINESGEEEHDALLEAIYERIARALLGRATVLTRSVEDKDPDKRRPTGLAGAGYTPIAEEADAMAAYFSVLDEPDSEAAKQRAKLPARRRLTTREFGPELLAKLDKEQVRKDYEFLLTKQGAPANVSGDAVFVNGGPGRFRDPRRGFLSIPREVVEGMQAAGLRWGGTDFGGECGDMMHFDDGNRHADYVAYGKAHPTDKRKAEG